MPDQTPDSKSVVTKKDTTIQEENKRAFLGIRWGDSYVSLLLGAVVVVLAAVLGFFYVKIHQPKQELLPPATTSRNITITVSLTSSPSEIITQIPTLAQIQTFPGTRPSKTKQTNQNKTYVVQRNDNLWTIAEKEYGSGYNWVSIAKANNLTNPGMIFSGNTIVIPSVTPILVKKEQIKNSMPSFKLTPAERSMQLSTKSEPATATRQIIVPNISITGLQYTVQKGDSLWTIAVRAYGDGYRWTVIAKANNLANPSLIHSGNVLQIPRK